MERGAWYIPTVLTILFCTLVVQHYVKHNSYNFSRKSKPIRVYVDMVADLFHYGHVEFLRQAKQLGDHLVVGICSDHDVKTYKRKPILSMEERMVSVKACRYVDEVLPDAPIRVTQEWIDDNNIDVVVHGDDFEPDKMAYYYEVPIALNIFRTVPYTKGVSTSQLIKRIKERTDL
jgi:glycerol-3-phosphate cytidylyltransferase